MAIQALAGVRLSAMHSCTVAVRGKGGLTAKGKLHAVHFHTSVKNSKSTPVRPGVELGCQVVHVEPHGCHAVDTAEGTQLVGVRPRRGVFVFFPL